MPWLKNIYLENTVVGNLVYPSTNSSKSANGGNYMERGGSRPTPDSHLFPAIVLDPRQGRILTPTGIRYLSGWSLVSKSDH